MVGLIVAAATVSADLASFGGPLDVYRVALFGLAGVFAGTVVMLTFANSKKGPRDPRFDHLTAAYRDPRFDQLTAA